MIRFSIVVTTFNRPAQLANCLGALARLNYPRDRFEVVVVDDGGGTPLESVTAAHADAINIRLVQQPNGGAASGRNRGASLARGEYLAFTDDDCLPDPEWLNAMDERLLGAPQALVGGRTLNGLPGNAYSSASQVIVDVVYAFYNRDPQHARFFATNNMAVPASRFRELNGLDESMRIASEDREFCRRWLLNGGAMIYAQRALVVHCHPLTLRHFWRQHFAYGRGAARFHHHVRSSQAGGPSPGVLRGIGEPLNFYTSLIPRFLRAASSAGIPAGRAWLAFAVWQWANVCGYLYELLKGRR